MPARGRHLCALGSTTKELFDIAAPFLRAGLTRGEKCVFLAHDHEPRAIRRELTARRLPLRVGRLPGVEVSTCEQAGLAVLPFSPKRTVQLWLKASEAACAEGFVGLRVVVEMTWALYGGLDRLAEYEALSESLFHTQPLSALCHYDRLRFSEAVLRDTVLALPNLGVDGELAANPNYRPCDALQARLRVTKALSGAKARNDQQDRQPAPAASRRRS